MATSTIPNPNNITTIPLSINTDAATGSGTIIVCGRVATISAIINSSVTGADKNLAWIPGASSSTGGLEWVKPSADKWLSCNYYHSSGEQEAEAKITSGGYINISTPVSGKDFKISGTWITKGEG